MEDLKNYSLEHLKDEVKYFEMKRDYYKSQTLMINNLIHNKELRSNEILKEHQEMIDKIKDATEKNMNLVTTLNRLRMETDK